MIDVFLSYSSKDRARVKLAHDLLVVMGFNVFWDAAVPTAADWDRLIRRQLDRARVVVVFWTRNSAASENVRHEALIAREDQKLVQVMLEDMSAREMPMGMHIDQAARLVDWTGGAADPEWEKLVQEVKRRATPGWVAHHIDSETAKLRQDLETSNRALLQAQAERDAARQGPQFDLEIKALRDALAKDALSREEELSKARLEEKIEQKVALIKARMTADGSSLSAAFTAAGMLLLAVHAQHLHGIGTAAASAGLMVAVVVSGLLLGTLRKRMWRMAVAIPIIYMLPLALALAALHYGPYENWRNLLLLWPAITFIFLAYEYINSVRNSTGESKMP